MYTWLAGYSWNKLPADILLRGERDGWKTSSGSVRCRPIPFDHNSLLEYTFCIWNPIAYTMHK